MCVTNLYWLQANLSKMHKKSIATVMKPLCSTMLRLLSEVPAVSSFWMLSGTKSSQGEQYNVDLEALSPPFSEHLSLS